MVRLLIALILVLSGIVAVAYLISSWLSAPHRRLMRQFRKMRGLIIDGIDEDQKPHAERLLEDCERHLEGLIQARQRLDILTDMADAASDYVDADQALEYEELESRIQDDVRYFLEEMGRISAQVDYDWRQSIQRLEAFTDELEEQRQVFAELEDLPDNQTELETELEARQELEQQAEQQTEQQTERVEH